MNPLYYGHAGAGKRSIPFVKAKVSRNVRDVRRVKLDEQFCADLIATTSRGDS
jgi:hypothetical protein